MRDRKHRVAVEGREEKGSNTLLWHAPKKYAELNASGLEVEITGPTANVEIKLIWDGGNTFTERIDGERARK
jgi:hypothetical protein